MFSLPDLFSARRSRRRRSSFANLDFSNPSQLAMILLGSVAILVGLRFRRPLIGFATSLGGAAVVHRSLNRLNFRRSRARRSGTQFPHRTPGGGVPDRTGEKIVRSVWIDRPAAEIYRYVHDLENAPNFIPSVESVHVLDETRSHWVARTSDGETAEWYLEIINEHPDEMIAWQSMQGSDIEHAGSIRFEACGDGTTEVKVALEYHVEGMGEDQEAFIGEQLARLKFVMESSADMSSNARTNPVIL